MQEAPHPEALWGTDLLLSVGKDHMTCSAAADRPHSEASPHPSDGRPAAGRTSPRHLACSRRPPEGQTRRVSQLFAFMRSDSDDSK